MRSDQKTTKTFSASWNINGSISGNRIPEIGFRIPVFGCPSLQFTNGAHAPKQLKNYQNNGTNTKIYKPKSKSNSATKSYSDPNADPSSNPNSISYLDPNSKP